MFSFLYVTRTIQPDFASKARDNTSVAGTVQVVSLGYSEWKVENVIGQTRALGYFDDSSIGTAKA